MKPLESNAASNKSNKRILNFRKLKCRRIAECGSNEFQISLSSSATDDMVFHFVDKMKKQIATFQIVDSDFGIIRPSCVNDALLEFVKNFASDDGLILEEIYGASTRKKLLPPKIVLVRNGADGSFSILMELVNAASSRLSSRTASTRTSASSSKAASPRSTSFKASPQNLDHQVLIGIAKRREIKKKSSLITKYEFFVELKNVGYSEIILPGLCLMKFMREI